MHKTIIADTSCFIVLTNIGELDLLHKVYGQIITTPEIAAEFGAPLPVWVGVAVIQEKNIQRLLEFQLDKGEASALALALETPNSVVVIDDYRARKTAEKLQINYTGTIGVIVKAKITGIISSILPLVGKIRQTDFRITDELEQQALRAAGEK